MKPKLLSDLGKHGVNTETVGFRQPNIRARLLPYRYLNKQGFSLIELMIVIAIIAIMAAITAPSIIKWRPNYQLKKARQELYSNLQKAKLQAVKANKKVTFNFTADPNCTTATGYEFKEGGTVVASASLPSNGVCLSGSSFTNGSSGFNPRGYALGGLIGEVKLKHARKKTREWTIAQNVAGGIQIK